MARVTLLICDSCDNRDNVEQPPTHGISAYDIQIRVVDQADEIFSYSPVYLCKSCLDSLKTMIITETNNKPGKA